MSQSLTSPKENSWIVVGLIALAVLSRWLPHPPNFTPIIGVALFAGASFRSRSMSFFVPLVALLVSDLVIGFHSTMWAVYLGMLVITWMGAYGANGSGLKLAGLSTGAATFFFVLTNAAVWMTQEIYPRTFDGLVSCFTMALPFFPATLVSAWVYTGALFGLSALLGSSQLAKQKI